MENYRTQCPLAAFILLAHLGCEKRSRRWAYVMLLFLFLTNFVRSIISTSTEPIFAKFAGLVELWLKMNDLKLVFDPPRDVAGHTTRNATAAQDAGKQITLFC